MNKKIDLSLLKDKLNGVALIGLIMVLLVALMGFTSWYTIKSSIETKATIQKVVSDYNSNKILVGRLEALKSNANEYIAQKEKYDAVIAEEGSYSVKGYTIELDELCTEYHLDIVELNIGQIEKQGNVNVARTTLTVVGDELDVRKMAAAIVSQQYIARIDDIAMAKQEDGTVAATMTIVNFTK
ncbi:MAG: hypothetical protein ACI4N4_04950 [Candidatus Fimenecus sp.]